ncbi:hypothetical protein AB1Y20_006374 [Prymnesium parvum]|uniref:Uncharacterized protein n=1 Tax=Prymnesium parvum TaxID=97485 RepID=A0AB34J4K2_PRYPA
MAPAARAFGALQREERAPLDADEPDGTEPSGHCPCLRALAALVFCCALGFASGGLLGAAALRLPPPTATALLLPPDAPPRPGTPPPPPPARPPPPPSRPPPAEEACGVGAAMINLRGNRNDIWCNSDAARRDDARECEQYWLPLNDGSPARCIFRRAAGGAGSCEAVRVSELCSPPSTPGG